MPIVHNVEVPLEETNDLTRVAARELGVDVASIRDVVVIRRSIDARGRRAPRWVLSLQVIGLEDEAPAVSERAHPLPELRRRRPERVVVVGAGPAGLFAALRLAEGGLSPILIDRGSALEQRHGRARRLRAEGVLDPESNLCFGEGGAGAYSDGKLYTRKRSPLVREVYRRLVEFGGDPNILVDAHPHIGTNRLIPLLRRMHDHLVAIGVEMRFDTRLDDLLIDEGALRAVVVGGDEIATDTLILATGHSARTTYAMMAERGVLLESKPFAVGARVEHPQSLIDRIQFGDHAGHPALGAAEYFLRCKQGGRGVYSFCMCPGGFIIPTPTEPGHLNVNGMSNQARKNHFGNAALVVTVGPEDFAPTGNALDGLAYQRNIERQAFEVGGQNYAAPATRLTDFVAERGSTTLPTRTSYRPSLTPADIASVLPLHIVGALRSAVVQFERQMRGYLTNEAVIVAAETTTSSPIRVVRGEDFQSLTVQGLYPTGEGAGYSGGIASSAMDGIRVADRIIATP
jgi:uncharacterized FAD-dependent dehydrogenase